jgi:uncharacterized GH25 family protein
MNNVFIAVKPISLYALLIFIFFASRAFAHDMWIEVRDYTPSVGEKITMVLGYDHYLPARKFLPHDYLDKIYLLDPEAKLVDMKPNSELEYSVNSDLTHEGSYLAVAVQKGRFWTKTTEGYQSGKSKKGLKNIISCTYSTKFAKAVVNVGIEGGLVVSKPVGHELEIIPLADPAAIQNGDQLPLKILFRDKPLHNHQILATYVGFSREKNTFAFASKTDDQGMVAIKILTDGAWLVTTHYKETYLDTSECDVHSLASSLTFEIR